MTTLCVAAGLMASAPGWSPARAAAATAARPCCRAQAGTAVEVALAEPLSTRTTRTGDTFALRLAAPLIVQGRVVLPAGTPGMGEVVESSRPGMGGKAAKLVLAARYLTRHGRRIPLDGLQLSAAGKSRTMTARAVGLTGLAFAPLGFVGLAVEGGQVDFPEGVKASAQLAQAVTLPPLRRATAAERAHAAKAARAADDAGLIVIPPPPAGEGQVVFFRRKTLLGTAQWFKVREDGKALGKLTNGAYFIQPEAPGVHNFTATFEPELKDHLILQVDTGETYFVEGTTTRALVIGAADLYPSSRAAFEAAAKGLKPVPTLDDGEPKPSPKAPAPAADADTPVQAPAPTPTPIPSPTPAPTQSPPDPAPRAAQGVGA
jgi:hypothetical protein